MALRADAESTVPCHDVDDRPITTVELVGRCREGDEAAWDHLVGRYERLVFTVARRNGLGTADAADVTQATFEILLDEIDSLRSGERLGSWLATVARRQAWRTSRHADRETPREILPRPDPHDANEDLERFIWVYEAVVRLHQPCRDLILALFFDPSEPSYADVAVRIGRPAGSIGPLRSRCLGRLREELERGAM